MIKNDPVFAKKQKGPAPSPVEWQLIVTLRYLGLSGSATSNTRQKNFFRGDGGKGSFENWRNNAIKAILNLRDKAIRWPNRKERRRIARRFGQHFGWHNCVFIIDGTLFPLMNKPQLEDAADYHGRKFGYTINAVILCDDQRRIRHYLSGNPGTCHDQRAWRLTKVFRNPGDYLDESQYRIGDSAFDPRWCIIPAFTRPKGAPMERPKEVFNNKMKKPQVISEHVNGILKGRFPILTSLPHVINDDEAMKTCLKVIDCCVILHNLLIGMRDDIPDAWRDEYAGEISDIDEAESGDDDEDRAAELLPDAPHDARRNRLLVHFNDNAI